MTRPNPPKWPREAVAFRMTDQPQAETVLAMAEMLDAAKMINMAASGTTPVWLFMTEDESRRCSRYQRRRARMSRKKRRGWA